MFSLETPILGIIRHPEYEEFMRGNNAHSLSLANFCEAKSRASELFVPTDTAGKVWNTIALQRARFCGKIHEVDDSEIVPSQCEDRNNPCCGHPENTTFYHGVGVGGFLARKLDDTIEHPRVILNRLSGIDQEAQLRYGTGGVWDYSPILPSAVPPAKIGIILLERKLYETVTKPWIERVACILRTMN